MKIINRVIKLNNSKQTIIIEPDRYKEMCLSLRRSMFLLVTYSVFCLSMLFVSDEYLMPQLGKLVQFSLMSIPLSLEIFIFVGPIFLLAVTAYFNVFLKLIINTDKCNLSTSKKFPIIFNLGIKKMEYLAFYLSVINVPLIMLLYSYKINPHPYFKSFLFFTVIVISVSYFNSYAYKDIKKRVIPLIILWVILGFTTVSELPRRLYILDRVVFPAGLDMSRVNLDNVSIRFTNLEKMRFQYASFKNANLEGANLKETDLIGSDFTEAILQNVDFQKSKLTKTKMNMANLTIANFSNTELLNVELIDADLNSANFEKANLYWVDLSQAYMENVNLQDAKLESVNMEGVNFENANMARAMIEESNMKNTNLDGADLVGAKLTSVNLENANFENSDLENVDFFSSNLTGSKFKDANLAGVNVTCKQIKSVASWDNSYDGPSCNNL